MGMFSKLKKQLKKKSKKLIGKSLLQGLEKIGPLLPPPVGQVATMVTKGAKLADKISQKAKGLKSKLPKTFGEALESVGKASKKSKKAGSPLSVAGTLASASPVASGLTAREQRKLEKRKARARKKLARADGYRSYGS